MGLSYYSESHPAGALIDRDPCLQQFQRCLHADIADDIEQTLAKGNATNSEGPCYVVSRLPFGGNYENAVCKHLGEDLSDGPRNNAAHCGM